MCFASNAQLNEFKELWMKNAKPKKQSQEPYTKEQRKRDERERKEAQERLEYWSRRHAVKGGQPWVNDHSLIGVPGMLQAQLDYAEENRELLGEDFYRDFTKATKESLRLSRHHAKKQRTGLIGRPVRSLLGGTTLLGG